MVWAGREVGSRPDHILGKDCRLFWNVSVRDPRHNLDHYLVLGCLQRSPLREHSEYLGKRTRLPPTTPNHPHEGVRFLCGPTEGHPESEG